MLISELAGMTNNEIFSKLDTSIAYCRWLGKGWSVYKVPGREGFTVSKTKDMYTDRTVYQAKGHYRNFDPRWVVFSL